MEELGVCAVCGQHLGQRVGTLAMRHGHVSDPNPCVGFDVPVMSVRQWEDAQSAPMDGWEL